MTEHSHGADDDMPEALIGLVNFRRASDTALLAARAAVNTEYEFLDSLNPSQLMALRSILNTDADSRPNALYDGMVITLLRVKHGCDPYTGKNVDEALAEMTAGENITE